MRIHNSSNPKLKFFPIEEQLAGWKPNGLWYAIDRAWLEWCEGEMPEWIKQYNFEIEVNEDRILKITKGAEILEFTRLYSCPGRLGMEINWEKVAKKYSGIEITPYLWQFRLNLETGWYYTWDCASGCIWGADAIRGIRTLAAVEEKVLTV